MTFLESPMTWSQVDAAVATVDGVTPDLIAELEANYPKFKLFTDAFTAGEQSVDGATIKTLHCTASSTITDLHGDSMTQDCVRDMAKQARKGLTIFLNHSYKAPEDVAGKVVRASAANSGETDEESGQEIWDLHYDIALTRNNDRVAQVYRQVAEDGIRLGISIGAYILEYDYKDKEKGFWGGLIINKVLLVETSIVGIPANQRSWIQNGVMGIGKFLGLKALFNSDEPEFRLEKRLIKVLDGAAEPPETKAEWDTAYVNDLPDSAFACIEPGGKKDDSGKTTPRSKRHYPHHDKGGKVDTPHLNAALSRIADKSNYQCDGGEAHLKAHKGGKSHEHMGVEELAMTEHITDASQLTQGEAPMIVGEAGPEQATDTVADGSTDNPETVTEESSDSPEVAAEAAPVQESTAEQTTEASADEPAAETTEESSSALEEAAPEIALSLESGTTPAVELVLAALEHAAEQVRELKAEKTSLEAQVASLTGERDKAIDDAKFAAEILVRVAKSPLGRKTQFTTPIQSFHARFAGVYDEAFLKLMDETE